LNGGGEKAITLQHADKVEIVEIIRKLGQVISKTSNKVQVMDMVSYETLDASAPSEIFSDLNEGDQVTFIDLKGDVKILEKR
jgi:translation elongation factor P/translation initiation factor 5A